MEDFERKVKAMHMNIEFCEKLLKHSSSEISQSLSKLTVSQILSLEEQIKISQRLGLFILCDKK